MGTLPFLSPEMGTFVCRQSSFVEQDQIGWMDLSLVIQRGREQASQAAELRDWIHFWAG